MKKLNLTDNEYDLLMSLSKELQEQDNDWQAFPYFWEPRSTKTVLGTEDDNPIIYSSNAGETLSLKDYAEYNEEEFRRFLRNDELNEPTDYKDILEEDWMFWLISYDSDISIVYEKEEKVSEHNFSFFKSDVQHFIKFNAHHLGLNPHTYARTFFRMDKMEKLMKLIYKLNKTNPKTNAEAKIYITEEVK